MGDVAKGIKSFKKGMSDNQQNPRRNSESIILIQINKSKCHKLVG